VGRAHVAWNRDGRRRGAHSRGAGGAKSYSDSKPYTRAQADTAAIFVAKRDLKKRLGDDLLLTGLKFA
jgi:hypothetical protein